MQNNIRNTNLRFNLDKNQQRKAREYLQTMDRQDFKSYSQVISITLVDYFDRYYRTQADPYLETREREKLFCETDYRSSGKQPETVIATFSFQTDCRHSAKGAPNQGVLSST